MTAKAVERLKKMVDDIFRKQAVVGKNKEISYDEILVVRDAIKDELTLREFEIIVKAIDLCLDDFLAEGEHHEPDL